MTIRSWIGALCSPSASRPLRKGRSRTRLALESLEERWCPSTVTEGPSAGTASDIVLTAGAWTATANDPWLHTASAGNGNGLATFTFDTNPGATRTGTLTIAGQTLTLTQAGDGYVAANPLITLTDELNGPSGVAVDGAGNVYIADGNGNAVYEWNASTQQLATLIDTGLSVPSGVAVDAVGNIYVADTFHSAIKVWSASTHQVTPLVDTGLNYPAGVAVDTEGNVYIADTLNEAIKVWNASTQQVSTLVSSGLNTPTGVAVDAAGNVYIADSGNNAVKVWSASTHLVSPLVSSGLNDPYSVAVDSAGNVFIADVNNNAIKEWNAATQQVSILVSGLMSAGGVAVDSAGNISITDGLQGAIQQRVNAYVNPRPVSVGANAGSDSLVTVLPTTQSLTGVFAPTSDQSWLSIGTSAGGVVAFSFTANPGPDRTAHITVLGQQITVTQTAALGSFDVLEGPAAGSDSSIVAVSGAWTATSNDPWLHSTSAGSGNGLATFTFDANTGATRTGTLTIAGRTVTVTQAGVSYVAANAVIPLVSSGLNFPAGVAVDATGNVYIADSISKAIKKWDVHTQQVSTLISAGLNDPTDVALDAAGNVYIADAVSNSIRVWNASTQQISTLVSGLNQPFGLDVDKAGNVYIADTYGDAIKMWSATTHQVTPLVSSGLVLPSGVAVDAAGNVYIADRGNKAIKVWNATTHQVSTLVSSGLIDLASVAVDGAGNVFIADKGNNAILMWNASTHVVSTLFSSDLILPTGVTVDAAGNVVFADANNNIVNEIVRAFVPGDPFHEAWSSGSNWLLPVLPATQPLTGVFAPSTDQPWLTLGPIVHNVIPFSFTTNTGPDRTAHISVLGQSITVTQAAPLALGASALLVGPTAGGGSDIVAGFGPWTATSNAPWLHTTSAGTGNRLATFTFDANTGATRTGTLTIAGQTLTVTQAGSTYVAASPVIPLVSSGLSFPAGVALDATGNVYIADSINKAIKKWNIHTQQVSTLISAGLSDPTDLALDAAGNVYIADAVSNSIRVWNASTQQISTLVSGLNQPFGVDLDQAGNVYIADTYGDAIKMWSATTHQVTTLVSSGLVLPSGVAVDAAGNVFIADQGNKAIKVWDATTHQVSTLISPGLIDPASVAVDGEGNVFIADKGDNAVKMWNASTHVVSTLTSSGPMVPTGVAVDAAGNVIFADAGTNTVNEIVRAYVPGAPVSENSAAGLDALLPVLPTTQLLAGVFAPSSDQSWLTIGPIADGVIHFSFTTNTGAARTAHITVLGQSIAVTQDLRQLGASSLMVGPSAGQGTDIVVTSDAWTATSSAFWLHTTSTGNGNGLATFTFDANTGPTRIGTLTIAGMPLTVTQAGSSYIAANPFVPLVPSGLTNPYGVAVDTAGNVYFSDSSPAAIKKWNAATQQISTLASTGLNQPYGVAVDATGNVYFTDQASGSLYEWNAATQQAAVLVSGLNEPLDVAVDQAGNVYIAEYGNNAITKWTASTRQAAPLFSASLPEGVAVDSAGNVYFSHDTLSGAVDVWNAVTQQISPVVTGLTFPAGVAVDGSGNVYIADQYNSAILKWNASTMQVATLTSAGLDRPYDVAVDAAGNVYIADTSNGAIETLVNAFVPGGAPSLGSAAGSETLLPVLPRTQSLTGVFAPSSDQSWLTIGLISDGVIQFSFAANTGLARTAHITVLGQSIPVSQAGPAAGVIPFFSHGSVHHVLSTPNTSQDQAFLAGLYHMILNRDGDAQGMADWMNALAAGVPRESIVDAFWGSAEHRGLEADHYYQRFLARPADSAGRAMWVSLLAGGLSESDVALGFLSSAEYQAIHSSSADYVASLYEKLLGRTGDPAGAAAWIEALDSGAFDRTQVASEFLRSEESYGLAINNFYVTYYHRQPDAAGAAYWLEQMKIGIFTYDRAAKAFLSLPEFYGNALAAVESPETYELSDHAVSFVTVEPGVQLEVLDWGGTGDTMVLLAGLGDSAHIFDRFAYNFTDKFHVIGITRRGFGRSSQPADGYDVGTRASDDVAVLDALGIGKAIIVGHSIAGTEINALAVTYPERVKNLVYLDGLDNASGGWSSLPQPPPPPDLSDADLESVQRFAAASARNDGYEKPLSAITNFIRTDPTGRVVEAITPPEITAKIYAGLQPADYQHIQAPTLGIFNFITPEYRFPYYVDLDAAAQLAFRESVAAISVWFRGALDRFRSDVPNSQVVELVDTNHYVFIVDQALVVREMRQFLLGG